MDLALRRYSWLGLFVATVLCAYLGARALNAVAAGFLASKRSVEAAVTATKAQWTAPIELDEKRLSTLFGVPFEKPTPEGTGGGTTQPKVGWNPDPVRSSLHAVLVGTAIATPRRYSLTQLVNTDANETAVYAVGDAFMGARVYEVLRDRALIVNEGRNEFIDTSGPAASLGPIATQPGSAQGIKRVSDNQYSVPRRTIEGALADLGQLAAQARIVQSFKNGLAIGFKVFQIVPDSLYGQIGVENGDVLRRINGYELNSLDQALQVYQKLRDATRIELDLDRRGEALRKVYSIEQ